MAFSRKMKMSALVEKDNRLLTLVSRFGMDAGFGERSVDSFCTEYGIDPDTFLVLCEVYSNPKLHPGPAALRFCRINDILRYLNNSHEYYTKVALEEMSIGLENLIDPCTEPQKTVIRRFLADFRREIGRHFDFEEQSVIPYVKNLVLGFRNTSFTIDRFEENHALINETLSDLKNLIMKSLPSVCDPKLRFDMLTSIYSLQFDIERHTNIEDYVMVPMVRMLESPGCNNRNYDFHNTGDKREELSEREKEILVSVACGLLNKEIADKHNISINTVITHRKNITRKTGIKTVPGLTAYAILNNLIDINEIEKRT